MPQVTPVGAPAMNARGAPGTLFVVATPIGNLEDITLRALRVLREVSVIAAEDTRRTTNLLRHYDIRTPLLSLHEHNEHRRAKEVVARLLRGDAVALVSDAGTPGISDPGALLVRATRSAAIPVVPIPGASAVTAALSASGISTERFAFAGFPPTRSKDRKMWFDWVNRLADVPVIFFEAPHRIRRTVAECVAYFGNRPITVARELTKLHEEWADERSLSSEIGEFVVIIGQSTDTAVPASVSDSEVARIFGELTKSAQVSSRRAALKAVAERTGLSVKSVYAALERAKN